MAIEKKKSGIGAYIILALIPLVALITSTIIVETSTKATVVKNSGFKKDGYPDIPTTYQVEASPHHVYTEYWATGKVWIVIGWILAIVGPVVYFGVTNAQAKSNIPWGGFVFWVIGISLVWGLYAKRSGDLKYTKTVSEQVYQENLGHLDNLFP